jgi:hypothetical protein
MTLPMTMEAAATKVSPRISVMLLGAGFDISNLCLKCVVGSFRFALYQLPLASASGLGLL